MAQSKKFGKLGWSNGNRTIQAQRENARADVPDPPKE